MVCLCPAGDLCDPAAGEQVHRGHRQARGADAARPVASLVVHSLSAWRFHRGDTVQSQHVWRLCQLLRLRPVGLLHASVRVAHLQPHARLEMGVIARLWHRGDALV